MTTENVKFEMNASNRECVTGAGWPVRNKVAERVTMHARTSTLELRKKYTVLP